MGPRVRLPSSTETVHHLRSEDVPKAERTIGSLRRSVFVTAVLPPETAERHLLENREVAIARAMTARAVVVRAGLRRSGAGRPLGETGSEPATAPTLEMTA